MFERQYVEYALELARTDKNMTQLEFAKAVWPLKTEASATTTIIALKRQNSRGKPQNLRVGDAIRMAEVLGREYPSMCFEVWEKVKMRQRKEATIPPPTSPPRREARQEADVGARSLEAVSGDIGEIP